MNEIRDEAVVLRTYKSGEADRIAVLWTREHGKIKVLAKGARKQSSRLGGALEVLAHVDVDLVATRGDIYITRHIQHVNRHEVLRGDLERLQAGYGVVEAIDHIPDAGPLDTAIFDTATRVLIALDDIKFSPKLIPAAFYLRLLALDGSEPVVDECVNCGSPGPLVAFNAQSGGALCRNCRSGLNLSAEALGLLRQILGGNLAGVLSESDPAGASEVAAIALESIENHLGRRLRSQRLPHAGENR